MRINTNIASLNAWRNLSVNNSRLTQALERLSSGYRVNRASDDAAGLAVSEKMRAQIRGIGMAMRNTQDGIALVQTAEGGAGSIQNMLQRMRELAVQAASDTLNDTDRAQLQKEFDQLRTEIDRTATVTKYNNIGLLDGSSQNVTKAKITSGASSWEDDGAGTNTGVTLSNGAVVKFDTGYTTTNTKREVAISGTFTLEITDSDATAAFAWGGAKLKDSTGQVLAEISASAAAADRKFILNGISIDLSTYATDGGGTSSFTLTAGTTDASTASTNPNPVKDKSLAFQIGSQNTDVLKASLADLSMKSLLLDGLDISTKSGATTAIARMDLSLSKVNAVRAELGAMQNRLDNAVSTLQGMQENLTSAESRIRDVDMAMEMATFTKFQILGQASTAMLAQANQVPQGILQLLR